MQIINMAAKQDVINCTHAERLNISLYLVSECWSRFAAYEGWFCVLKVVGFAVNVTYLCEKLICLLKTDKYDCYTFIYCSVGSLIVMKVVL